jgi:predicted nucleic-acid-binding protein
MRAVDTNVLVRLLVRDDPSQARKADAYVAAGAWVSHLVLAETVWVLDSVYGLTRGQQATTVDMLLQHGELVVQDADVVERALGRFRGKGRADFSDCLALEIAHKAGHVPFGTFDRALGRLPGAESI